MIDNGIVSSLFCPRKSSGNRRVEAHIGKAGQQTEGQEA